MSYLLVAPEGVQYGLATAELVAGRPALRAMQQTDERSPDGTLARDIAHVRLGASLLDGRQSPFTVVLQAQTSLPIAPGWYRLGGPTSGTAGLFIDLLDARVTTRHWALREGYVVIEASSGASAYGRIGAVFVGDAGQYLTLSGRFAATPPPAGLP